MATGELEIKHDWILVEAISGTLQLILGSNRPAFAAQVSLPAGIPLQPTECTDDNRQDLKAWSEIRCYTVPTLSLEKGVLISSALLGDAVAVFVNTLNRNHIQHFFLETTGSNMSQTIGSLPFVDGSHIQLAARHNGCVAYELQFMRVDSDMGISPFSELQTIVGVDASSLLEQHSCTMTNMQAIQLNSVNTINRYTCRKGKLTEVLMRLFACAIILGKLALQLAINYRQVALKLELASKTSMHRGLLTEGSIPARRIWLCQAIPNRLFRWFNRRGWMLREAYCLSEIERVDRQLHLDQIVPKLERTMTPRLRGRFGQFSQYLLPSNDLDEQSNLPTWEEIEHAKQSMTIHSADRRVFSVLSQFDISSIPVRLGLCDYQAPILRRALCAVGIGTVMALLLASGITRQKLEGLEASVSTYSITNSFEFRNGDLTVGLFGRDNQPVQHNKALKLELVDEATSNVLKPIGIDSFGAATCFVLVAERQQLRISIEGQIPLAKTLRMTLPSQGQVRHELELQLDSNQFGCYFVELQTVQYQQKIGISRANPIRLTELCSLPPTTILLSLSSRINVVRSRFQQLLNEISDTWGLFCLVAAIFLYQSYKSSYFSLQPSNFGGVNKRTDHIDLAVFLASIHSVDH